MHSEKQSDNIEKERLAAINEIAVTINHKINNPLTTIINCAELLQLMVETKDQTKVIQVSKNIINAAFKIKEVTHSLTKIESSNSLHIGAINVNLFFSERNPSGKHLIFITK